MRLTYNLSSNVFLTRVGPFLINYEGVIDGGEIEKRVNVEHKARYTRVDVCVRM